jgi:hypothetical protein
LLQEAPDHPAFDLDTYKVLVRALAQGKLRVRPLTPAAGCSARA